MAAKYRDVKDASHKCVVCLRTDKKSKQWQQISLGPRATPVVGTLELLVTPAEDVTNSLEQWEPNWICGGCRTTNVNMNANKRRRDEEAAMEEQLEAARKEEIAKRAAIAAAEEERLRKYVFKGLVSARCRRTHPSGTPWESLQSPNPVRVSGTAASLLLNCWNFVVHAGRGLWCTQTISTDSTQWSHTGTARLFGASGRRAG